MLYLVHVHWMLGHLERTSGLNATVAARASVSGHVPTLLNFYHYASLFEMFRGNAESACQAADKQMEIGREHGVETFLRGGALRASWARVRLGDRDAGLLELRSAVAGAIGRGIKTNVPLFQGLLAELEAEGEGSEGALSRIDEALILAKETGEHCTDALLHRIRGEILLERDPSNTVLAEEAFLTAIAVAKEQKARSFELRAALSLAKLYQLAGRATDAHAVLASALEGFCTDARISRNRRSVCASRAPCRD